MSHGSEEEYSMNCEEQNKNKHEPWMQEDASGSMGREEARATEASPSESSGLRSRKRPRFSDSIDPAPAISRVNSFYIIENAEADEDLESPCKRIVSEGDAAQMLESRAPMPPGDEKDTPLMRWRSRVVPPDPKIRQGLSEVAQKRGWLLHRSSTLQGVHDRLDRFTQVLLSGERNSPLKKRFLLVAAIIGSIYSWSLTRTLRAQVQTWLAEPGPIGLTGIDGSIVVPLSLTFWYVVLCQILLRMMASTPPAEAFIFEVAVVYNVLQAGMSAYVAFMMFREFRGLNLNFVGNAVSHDPQEHRLGIIAILNYHLRKLELCDTLFLIMRKKLYRDSLHLHWSLRMLNIWSWHIACREGCGGDIYFPVVMNALCAMVLHVHYFLTLVEPHAVPLRWLPIRSFNPFNRSLASLRRTFVQVVQVGCFQLCLVYGFLSLYAGSYPRIVLVVNIAQCCIGILLYTDFHFRPKSDPEPVEPSFAEDEPLMERQISSDGDDGHNAKMAFSFDSSGWCYFYHFGVAMWVQEHFAEEINKGEMVFSGSSGGAIVGCALATNINIPEVLNSVIHRTYYNARRNPTKLPEEVQYTLEAFVPVDGHIRANNFLRVLLTRVQSKPPFFMGEVATQFRSRQHLFDVLAASSTIPVIFGMGKIIDGVRYIDGMFWTSSLVPWRSFKSQSVCRVSCFSAFGCDIGPRIWAVPPIWWTVFPPSQEALEGLFWAGYRDIAAAFGAPDGRPGGCNFCSRRQELPAELDKRPRLNSSSSRTIDELITVYERTARRDWIVFLGVCFVLNMFVWTLWLRDEQ